MDAIGFIEPPHLLLLLLVPLLAAFLFFRDHAKQKLLRAFGMDEGVRSRRESLVVLAILTALLLSVARPYWGYHDVTVPVAGRDMMIIFDVSKSMLARDMPPTRIEFAKRKVIDLINKTAKETPGDRIGLILFAGQSYIYCPLTSDYGILRLFVRRISTDMITSGGSAIDEAVQTALKSLLDVKAEKAALLLLSDGEDNQINVDSVIGRLKGQSVPLHVVGIGTTEGVPIEYETGKFLRDQPGNVVISKLNERSLQRLSTETGGTYQRATVDDTDLKNLSATHQQSTEDRKKEQRQVRVYFEIGPYLIWSALLLLALAHFRKQRGVIFSLLLLFVARPCSADESTPDAVPLSAREAYTAYLDGNYEKAVRGYSQAYSLDPQDRRIEQGLASALFKTGNYKDASKHFSDLATSARNGREKFEALYNLGNTQLQDKKFQDAIKSYEAALKIKNADEKAVHNLEIAKKLLEIQKQEEEQKKQQQKEDKKDQQGKNDSNNQEEKKEQEDKQQGDESQENNNPQNSEQQQQNKEGGKENQQEHPQTTPSPNNTAKEQQTPNASTTPQSDSSGESSTEQQESDKDQKESTDNQQNNQSTQNKDQKQETGHPNQTPAADEQQENAPGAATPQATATAQATAANDQSQQQAEATPSPGSGAGSSSMPNATPSAGKTPSVGAHEAKDVPEPQETAAGDSRTGTPQKEENSKEGEEPNEDAAHAQRDAQQSKDPEELKREEAKAWLDSLDDSSLLLRKKVDRTRQKSTQSW